MRHTMVASLLLLLLVIPSATLAAEEGPPVAGAFRPAGSLAEARMAHATTSLAGGQVLVAGGGSLYGPEQSSSDSVEVWDPQTQAFRPTGSLSSARALHTLTPLADGRVLAVGGIDLNGYPEPSELIPSAEVWDPTSEEFTAAGMLATARAAHTATRLSDGRVLVIGGTEDEWLEGCWGTLASAEVWDPATGAFTRTSPLAEARLWHTATTLPDGRVLVIGGVGETEDRCPADLASAEVWDPATGVFALAGSLAEPRKGHSATLLPDGRVLVAGGIAWDEEAYGYFAQGQAEMWDPVTESFSPAAHFVAPRMMHTATLLPGGRVLFVGGNSEAGHPLALAEVWDPEASPVADSVLTEARAAHTATLLEDGRVLMMGGFFFPDTEEDVGPPELSIPSVEAWDPLTGAFDATGSLSEARSFHTATLLQDGRVLVAGGIDDRWRPRATAELWDPVAATPTPMDPMAEARADHTATPLADGRVLIIGGVAGYGGAPLATSEIWDPDTRIFEPSGALALGRASHTATRLDDGRVLVVGEGAAEIWDPLTGSFSPGGTLGEARSDHTATLLSDGRVLVVGGCCFEDEEEDYLDPLSSAELWDPATGGFAPAGSLAEPREYHTATLLPDGRVLVVGGMDEFGSELASAELWDPVTETFGPGGQLIEARLWHSETLLHDGQVLIAGGSSPSPDGVTPSAEIWDPVSGAFEPVLTR